MMTGLGRYEDLPDRVVLGLEKTWGRFLPVTGVPSPRTPCPPTCVCSGALVMCAAEYPERRGASCGLFRFIGYLEAGRVEKLCEWAGRACKRWMS
jgi:hypothetical protein